MAPRQAWISIALTAVISLLVSVILLTSGTDLWTVATVVLPAIIGGVVILTIVARTVGPRLTDFFYSLQFRFQYGSPYGRRYGRYRFRSLLLLVLSPFLGIRDRFPRRRPGRSIPGRSTIFLAFTAGLVAAAVGLRGYLFNQLLFVQLGYGVVALLGLASIISGLLAYLERRRSIAILDFKTSLLIRALSDSRNSSDPRYGIRSAVALAEVIEHMDILAETGARSSATSLLARIPQDGALLAAIARQGGRR